MLSISNKLLFCSEIVFHVFLRNTPVTVAGRSAFTSTARMETCRDCPTLFTPQAFIAFQRFIKPAARLASSWQMYGQLALVVERLRILI